MAELKEKSTSIMSKKELDRHNRKILDLLDDLGGKHFAADDIIFEGEKLVIPKGMTLDRAVKFIQQKIAEDQAMTSFSKVFQYRPWDGAWCMHNVFAKTFGGVVHKGKMGWFGPEPPQMITVNSGVGETVQVPWGVFTLPIFEGSQFECDSYTDSEKGDLFYVAVNARKKDRFRIEGLFKLVEEELKTNSLYRGKAFDGQNMPEFIDVYSVDRSKVVYSEEVMTQLSANVWNQLRYTEACEREGIPLKRAVLIHGPFGTGKTLACMLTGQEAVENGWTFIKARPGKDNISVVLQTAKLYQPAVVFYEDVDVIADAERTDRVSMMKLLDDFDGVDAKGTRILAVLTTNYPDKIHAGMARPGRLDAMIEINELDAAGVRKLVETRIFNSLADDIDWDEVFVAAGGYKPAFVTEFADRTVRYLLGVEPVGTVEGKLVGTNELVAAAEGLRPQFNTMMGLKEAEVFDPMELAHRRIVTEAVRETVHPKMLSPSNGK